MKKVLFTIIILLISSEIVFAKEVRTRFGFYIDLPNEFDTVTANLDDLLNKTKDSELKIDKDAFNNMAAGGSKSDLDIEYYFPIKKYNAELNMVYIMSVDLDMGELLAFQPYEVCEAMTYEFSLLYQKKVNLYDCELNPTNIKKKNSRGVYFLESDGLANNQRLIIIMVEMKNKLVQFAAGCENKYCPRFKKHLINIANSRK